MLRRLSVIILCAILLSACSEGDNPFPYQPNLPTDFNRDQASSEMGTLEGNVASLSYEMIDEARGLFLRRLVYFDSAGRCLDYYHRDSRTTQRYYFAYDSFGRRIKETCYLDTAGTPYDSITTLYSQTTYRYSRNGLRCKARIQGANGRKYTFLLHFNDQGQLTKYIFPDGSRFSYEYDADGRLAKRVNPDASISEYAPAAVPQPIAYDSLGRVTAEKISDTTGIFMVYYTYGHHANWIRRTTTGVHSPTKLEVRRFEYYE